MPTSQQDTEITLGTGRMLALFLTFVLVCAVFFAIGFSLGRKTTVISAGKSLGPTPASPATIVRPSATRDAPPQPAAQPNDLSFYKSVSSNTPDAELRTADAQQPAPSTDQPKTAASAPSPASTTNGYFVQVAAVSRQEDAESLVEALKKKQYPAFAANNSSADKFFHVQVGPYADLKDAEAMRARLVADGYNPILKK